MRTESKVRFTLFEMDMVRDDDGWQENERHRVGTVGVRTNQRGEITARNVIAAVAGSFIKDVIGRSFPALSTTDMRRVYAEDLYGDGRWWEVGAKKNHMPLYGLMRLDGDS